MGRARDRADSQIRGNRGLVKDLRVFRVTSEGSTKHSPFEFGVDTAVWTVAAKKAGKRYRGFLEAAERLVKLHKHEAGLSRKRHTSVSWVVSKGMGRGGGTNNRR